MATETRPPARSRPPRLAPPARPGAEAKSWLFMRLSGLLLVFFALVHFAITHVLNDVVETDYRFVEDRWANPAWRVFDWMLLALALLHGANGARWVIEDYVRRPGRRAAAKTVAYGLTAALLAWGTFTIVTF